MIQAGQTAEVRVRVSAPDGTLAREGDVIAEFWAPGRDPEHDPGARAAPDHSFPCFPESRDWAALVSTEGWEPGEWVVGGRAAVATPRGPARGWAWSTLRVTP